MSIYIGDKEIKNLYAGGSISISDMQGPCPDGFHVPLKSEGEALVNAFASLGIVGNQAVSSALKLPLCGYRSPDASRRSTSPASRIWTSSGYTGDYSYYIKLYYNSFSVDTVTKATGCSIRPFKDFPKAPDSSRTVLYQGTGNAGVYHNSVLGLISISSDGTTWITIADKNLGATTVYNYGDTYSQANCGNSYQRGNNYGFTYQGTVTTSTTQVNASTYGPGNYYESSTFIKRTSSPYKWDSSDNANLRGGVTQGTSEKPKEVKAVYLGENKVRPSQPVYPTESIVYKMKADSSGNLYFFTSGLNTSGKYGVSYNRKVSVDGGAETIYSGTGSSGGSVLLGGYVANSEHIISIMPVTETYGWAKAFATGSSINASLVTEIIHDETYMGYATSATATGNYFRARQWQGCSTIKSSPEEVIPNTVTSVGTYFRAFQFYQCASLNDIKGWADLSIGASDYRYYQYNSTPTGKTMKVLSNVGYGATSDALVGSSVTSVSVPSAYLNNFKNSTIYPRRQITDSKFVGY